MHRHLESQVQQTTLGPFSQAKTTNAEIHTHKYFFFFNNQNNLCIKTDIYIIIFQDSKTSDEAHQSRQLIRELEQQKRTEATVWKSKLKFKSSGRISLFEMSHLCRQSFSTFSTSLLYFKMVLHKIHFLYNHVRN